MEKSITLRQSAYANKVLEQFGMSDCNAVNVPLEHKVKLHKDGEGEPIDVTEYRCIIGSLRYLLHTRPDLSFAVGLLSRYMQRPTSLHLKAMKQTLRYLKGTIHFGLIYTKGGNDEELVCYSNSDLAGDLDDRKSTGGMVFYINNCLVSWGSYK
ncbi:secreted RxLR effector protein 161-like [Dioscorea cayenensis subsp. rotundata]|uniref:Secreted RxLR effector protein 161-like n=1 Tax=Dioscorea cayennensis subsp. rotundata TaxID=55577 RepID=A0AB40BM76_DIOCR|nr:secreted RxLR effector protein 161-like [Dioscorea cayenensis subsp. rotundata]